jgi:hypothetical protein
MCNGLRNDYPVSGRFAPNAKGSPKAALHPCRHPCRDHSAAKAAVYCPHQSLDLTTGQYPRLSGSFCVTGGLARQRPESDSVLAEFAT